MRICQFFFDIKDFTNCYVFLKKQTEEVKFNDKGIYPTVLGSILWNNNCAQVDTDNVGTSCST